MLGTRTGPQIRAGGEAPDHAPLGKHQLLGPGWVQPPAEKGTQLRGCTQSGDLIPKRPPQDQADGRRREGQSVEGQILGARGKLSPLGSGASTWPRQGRSWEETEARRGWRRGHRRAQPGETIQVAAGPTSRPQRGGRSASRAPAPRSRPPWMGPTCCHQPRCLFSRPITSRDPRGPPLSPTLCAVMALAHPRTPASTQPACSPQPLACITHLQALGGRGQRQPPKETPRHVGQRTSAPLDPSPSLVPGLSGQQRRPRRLPCRGLSPTISPNSGSLSRRGEAFTCPSVPTGPRTPVPGAPGALHPSRPPDPSRTPPRGSCPEPPRPAC